MIRRLRGAIRVLRGKPISVRHTMRIDGRTIAEIIERQTRRRRDDKGGG